MASIEHVTGDAYDVKYSVTANIEDALRKFAELKAAVEDLKRSGGQFDIGNTSELAKATSAEKTLRTEIDQTSQSLARETSARQGLDKATQEGTRSSLEEYKARQALLDQAKTQTTSLDQQARAAASSSDTVARAVQRETAAKREELKVNQEIAQSLDDVSKAQTRALEQEVQTTQRRSIQVTQSVQQEVRAKQQEVQAYQDTARSIDDVTRAMAEQDKLFGAQAAAGRGAAGDTALAQFEARRAAEAKARSAATALASAPDTLIAGPNGELIQPGSQNTLKKFLADELRRQQSGQGGFNATQFASMATRAVTAQNKFDSLAGSDLTFADVPKLVALDKELTKIQKDFAGNVDIGLWARDLRQNLSDVAEATLGVSKDLESNVAAVRNEVESTAKLSDVLAHESIGDVSSRLKILMDKIADPNTATTFRTVLAELAGMDSQLAKASKSASPGFSQAIDESRRSLGDLGASLMGVSGDLDSQAKKLEDLKKRGTDTPFVIKNGFLTLGGTLEAVGKSVDNLGYRFIDLGTKMKGAGGGGGFFNTILAGAGDVGGFFSQFVGGSIRAVGAIAPFLAQLFLLAGILPGIIALIGAMGTGLIGLAGALAPLVGVFAFILPIVVALGISFGVLTAAIKPVISAVTNLTTATVGSTKTIAGLSPAAVQAAKDIFALKNAFSGANIQQPFWLGADKGLKALITTAGPLKTLFAAIAGAWGNTFGMMLVQLAKFVNSSEFKYVLSPNLVSIVTNLGKAFYELGGIFADVTTVASWFTNQVLVKLVHGLTDLQVFIDKQANNGGLPNFFLDSYHTAGLLWNIVSTFFNGLITLMDKFRPLGDDFLHFLDRGSNGFDKWSKKTNFSDWLKETQQLLSSVSKVLGDIIIGIARLGNNANSIAFFVGLFKDLNEILPPAFKLLNQLLNLLSGGLAPIGALLKTVAEFLGTFLTWMTKLIDKVESNPTGMRALKDLFTVLGSIVVSATLLAALDKLIQIGGTSWSKVSGPLKSLFNSLFGTNFGTGATPKDPLGLGPAGTAFAEKLDAAFKAGAETVGAAITEAMGTGGVKAGEEIGTAEAAGGAVAGTEMAGAEAGGGFIGGVSGWIKGGGFTKLLGGAILGGIAATTIAHAQGVSPIGNTQTPQQASQQAFSDAIGGAVAGSRFGPLGIGVGAIVGGLVVPLLTDSEFRRNIANFNEQLDQTITTDGKGKVIAQQLTGATPSQVLNGTTYYPNKTLLYHDPNAGKGPALLGGPNASIHAPTALTPGQLNNLLNSDQTRNNLPGTILPGQSPLGNVGLTGGGGRGLGFSEGVGVPPNFTKNAQAAGKAASSSIASDIANAFTSAWQFVDRNFFQKIGGGAKTAVGAIQSFFTTSIPHWYDSFAGVLQRNVQAPVRNLVTKEIPGFFTTTIPHWYDSFAGVLQRNLQEPVKSFITKDVPSFFTTTIPHWYDSFAGVLQRNVQNPVRKFIVNDVPSFFNTTIPHWYDSFAGVLQRNLQNPVRGFILKDIPSFFDSTIPHWFDSVSGWFSRSVISPISNFFTRSLPGVIIGGFKSGINWVISNVIGAGSNPSGGILGFLNKATGVVGVHIPGIPLLATGGSVPGPSHVDYDSVRAMLTPGEFVIRKRAAQVLGRDLLERLNRADSHFAGGGPVLPNPLGNPLAPPSFAGANPNASNNIINLNPITSIPGKIAGFVQGALRDTFDALWTPTVGGLLSPLGNNNVPAGVANDAALGIKKGVDSFLGGQDAKYAAQIGALIGSVAQAAPGTSGSAAQRYAASQLSKYGWGLDQFTPLLKLWNQESGWNANAVNPYSGAYGIPQSLGHGRPYALGDYVAQVNWGLDYIAGRYGNPAGAWAHEQANNWYNSGGMVLPNLGFGIKSAFNSFNSRPTGISSSKLSTGARALTDGSAMGGPGLMIGEMNIHNPVPQQTSETLARSNARLRVYRGRGN